MGKEAENSFGLTVTRAVVAHWRFIVGTAALGVVLGLVVTLFRPLTYESTASVLIYPPLFKEAEVSQRATNERDMPQISELMPRALPMETYRTIATSAAMARAVIEKTGLDELEPHALLDRMTVELVEQGSRSVSYGVQYTQVMHMTVRADDPEKAALLAQTWAELFIENMGMLSERGLEETNALLEEMHSTAASQLEDGDALLAAHRREWNLELLGAEREAKEAQLTQYESELTQTQVDIARLEKELETLRSELSEERQKIELFKAPPDTALWLGMLAAPEANGGGGAAPRLDAETGLRTEQLNPVFTELRTQIADARKSLEGLQSKRDRLKHEAEQLRTEIKRIQDILAVQDIQREELTRNRQLLETSYRIVRESYELGRLAAVSNSSDIVIAAPAVAPAASISPPPVMLVPSIGLVAGAIATGLVMLQAFYRHYVAPRPATA